MGTLPRYMICVYLASAKWMSTPPYSTKLWQFYAFLITWGLFLVVTPELKFTSCDQFMASLSAAMILRILYIPAGLSACIWGHFGPERKDTRWWVGGWVGGCVCVGCGGGYLSCRMTSYVQQLLTRTIHQHLSEKMSKKCNLSSSAFIIYECTLKEMVIL